MEAVEVRRQLKELMVSELNLEGKSPGDIDDAAPLFGEGLGLDSLDALQLAMSVEERFGVSIPEGPEARPIFASVNALVAHIVGAQRDGGEGTAVKPPA
jgi:acyl carrier protein